jgi:hypothetical protein
VLRMEHSLVWRWNLVTSESIPELPGKFWNVVVGEVCRSLGSIMWRMKCYLESRRKGMCCLR